MIPLTANQTGRHVAAERSGRDAGIVRLQSCRNRQQRHQHSTPTPSHLLRHTSRWEPHMQIPSAPLFCVSQTHGFWNQRSHIWTHQTDTDIHWANVHYLCFLAQPVFSSFLLASLSSGFSAVSQLWKPDSSSSPSNSWCLMQTLMCCAGNWGSLKLVTRMNLSFAAEVSLCLPFLWTVLMWARFIIEFDLFLQLNLKIHSKFLQLSGLSDLHVLLRWWTYFS